MRLGTSYFLIRVIRAIRGLFFLNSAHESHEFTRMLNGKAAHLDTTSEYLPAHGKELLGPCPRVAVSRYSVQSLSFVDREIWNWLPFMDSNSTLSVKPMRNPQRLIVNRISVLSLLAAVVLAAIMPASGERLGPPSASAPETRELAAYKE